MRTKIAIVILLIGLLTACSTQATSTPASLPTDQPALPTQAVDTAPAPTDTSAPVPTDTSVPSPTTAPTTAPVSQGPVVSYASDIQPLLKSRCGSCHGGGRHEEGLSVISYDDLMKGSDNGLVIIAGNAKDSLLVQQVASQEMPKRGPKLTPDQVQLITDWVNQGAQNN